MPSRRVEQLFVALALVALPTAAYGDEADRVRESIEILDELTRAGDNAIPTYILERAEAAVVIPSFLKGGFIVGAEGAEHGKGILSVRDRAAGTWSPPTFVALTGGSFGAQIVLLVMNRDAVNQLLQDKFFTLGASASVAAGPVGRSARAATDYHLESQILAYSRAKGLFAGATLNGTALQSDHSAIEAFYGRFNVGTGAMGFASDHVGFRGDLRYVRSFEDLGETLDAGSFEFWRGTAGLTFRW